MPQEGAWKVAGHSVTATEGPNGKIVIRVDGRAAAPPMIPGELERGFAVGGRHVVILRGEDGSLSLEERLESAPSLDGTAPYGSIAFAVFLFVAAILFAVWALRGRVEPRAEALLDEGKAEEAQALLEPVYARSPERAEVRFLLGRAYLLEGQPDRAALLFGRLDASWKRRMANAWRDGGAATDARGNEAAAAIAFERAAATDPALTSDACNHALSSARARRARHAQHLELVSAAIRIGGDCRSQALVMLRNWMAESISADDADAAIAQAVAASSASSSLANEFASALRDGAGRLADRDRAGATKLLQSALRIEPSIGSDLETVVLKSNLLPATGVQAAVPHGSDLYSGGTPLEVTKRVMIALGDAIDAFVTDQKRHPAVASIDDLQNILAPYLHGQVLATDGWGNALVYVAGPGGTTARLISGGADGQVAAASRDFSVAGRGVVDDRAADVIWERGHLIEEPSPTAVAATEPQKP